MLAGEIDIADDPQLAADNLRALTLTSGTRPARHLVDLGLLFG